MDRPLGLEEFEAPKISRHSAPEGGKDISPRNLSPIPPEYTLGAIINLGPNTGCLQMNGEVSKVNKKFISHLTRAKRTPSAAATVKVSHALPAVRFSCLLRGQIPRWRRSRKRLSVCSVLRCPDL